MKIKSVPFCRKFNHAIDDKLLKSIKSECAKNGCSECPEKYRKTYILSNENESNKQAGKK